MHICTKNEDDPSNGSWFIMKIVYFCLFYWPLLPLTFDLITPKSNQIIITLVCTHVSSITMIRQMVLELSGERAIFTYLLTSVTFDLWPHDPKIHRLFMCCEIHLCTYFEQNQLKFEECRAITSYFCLFIDLCDLWPLTSWPQIQ